MSKRTNLNTIRIIGGQWRGRRLPIIDADGLRPTINRVRETLFNWLMHDLSGARCLDLFAGSGALGLESLSRGADYVKLNESNKEVAAQLQKNLAVLLDDPNSSRADVQCVCALRYLAKSVIEPFDIVFLDPPFQANIINDSLSLLVKNNYLAKGAMVYLEYDANNQAPNIPSSWRLHRQGKAGQSAYYLYIS